MKWAGMKYKSDLVLVSRDKCFFSLSIAKLRLQVHITKRDVMNEN